MAVAVRRPAETLADEFRMIPFEPYAPVRQQLLNLLRAVNRVRMETGRTRSGAGRGLAASPADSPAI